MSAKKNFLRNILTTTSALAVIAGASSNAIGALNHNWWWKCKPF